MFFFNPLICFLPEFCLNFWLVRLTGSSFLPVSRRAAALCLSLPLDREKQKVSPRFLITCMHYIVFFFRFLALFLLRSTYHTHFVLAPPLVCTLVCHSSVLPFREVSDVMLTFPNPNLKQYYPSLFAHYKLTTQYHLLMDQHHKPGFYYCFGFFFFSFQRQSRLWQHCLLGKGPCVRGRNALVFVQCFGLCHLLPLSRRIMLCQKETCALEERVNSVHFFQSLKRQKKKNESISQQA